MMNKQKEDEEILEQAKDAGEQYARDQIDGDHFRDWVYDQIHEASRMDPSQVLPLETKADAKVIAKNTLQQLGWDTKRELASFDILEMSGASGNDTDESDVLGAFYEGFDGALHDPNVVDWLADEILSMHEQATGHTAEGARETARRPSGKPFAGIDANDRAFHGVHNALVGIFLDGVKGVSPDLGHYQPTPEQADATLERARRLLADFESQTRIPRGRAQRWMENKIDQLRRYIEKAEAVRSGERPQQMTPEDYENLRKHLHRPHPREAAPRSKAPPKRFKSPGGRTFTLGSMERTPPRFEGDRSWQEMWPILYKSEPAGKLFRSATYRAPLEWHATTRELYWKYASKAPTGIGFDVAAFATPKEALDAWGRSADQILDWSEALPQGVPLKKSPRKRSRKR